MVFSTNRFFASMISASLSVFLFSQLLIPELFLHFLQLLSQCLPYLPNIPKPDCLHAIKPLQRHALLFTTKSPGVPGTHFINPG